MAETGYDVVDDETADRMAVVRRLRGQGWRHTELCAEIQLGDEQLGGPTYMADPEGVICALTEVSCTPISGQFTRAHRNGARAIVAFAGGRMVE